MLQTDPIRAFLLAFPALVSIVNPLAVAFIFREATRTRPDAERATIARRVGVYSLMVMLGALWAGSYVLSFFGISLAALRIAGGVVVAIFAWELLTAPERREARKQEQAGPAEGADDIAFYPLTLPVATGPGTIAVAIALGAGRPHPGHWAVVGFMLGMTAAAAATAVSIWITCRSADRLAGFLGPAGSRIVTRLSAFLLLCIGVQILITGVSEMIRPLVDPS